jgi:tripartite-type tricarboxylate transporter receptor subunit TctC
VKKVMLSIALMCALVTTGSAAAQPTWPTKPVRLFVAAAPGSSPDIIGRVVTEKLTHVWGQPIVIENRVGAGGNLGTQAAARAGADGGYNLLLGQAAPLSMNQYLFKSMPFDAEKEFVPIVSLGVSPAVIAVNVSLPAKTLAELVALAKQSPGKLSFATPNTRSLVHIAGVMFAEVAGINIVHAAYSSNAQAAQETIAGITQIYVEALSPVLPYVEKGQLRLLAVTSAERLPNYPDIPTVAETLPGFVLQGWFAIMGMTGIPTSVVSKVNADVNAVIKQPDLAVRLAQFGMYHPGGTPQELDAFISSERKAFAKAIAIAKLERE